MTVGEVIDAAGRKLRKTVLLLDCPFCGGTPDFCLDFGLGAYPIKLRCTGRCGHVKTGGTTMSSQFSNALEIADNIVAEGLKLAELWNKEKKPWR